MSPVRPDRAQGRAAARPGEGLSWSSRIFLARTGACWRWACPGPFHRRRPSRPMPLARRARGSAPRFWSAHHGLAGPPARRRRHPAPGGEPLLPRPRPRLAKAPSWSISRRTSPSRSSAIWASNGCGRRLYAEGQARGVVVARFGQVVSIPFTAGLQQAGESRPAVALYAEVRQGAGPFRGRLQDDGEGPAADLRPEITSHTIDTWAKLLIENKQLAAAKTRKDDVADTAKESFRCAN